MASQIQERTKVFISYSHEDHKWLERLNVHLKPLGMKNDIEVWTDKGIEPGMQWRAEIDRALNAARVAVLLLSADFLASDFINDVEMPALLEAARNGGTDILIVVLGPILPEGETPIMLPAVENLLRYQTVNNPKSPLKGMEEVKQDEVWITLRSLVQLAFRRQQMEATAAAGPRPLMTLVTQEGRGPAPKADNDCLEYAMIFDIHVESGRKTIPLLYAAAVGVPLLGLTLIMAGWVVPDFRDNAPLLAAMTALGAAACGLSFYFMKKIVDTSASIRACEFMRRRFEHCTSWAPGELAENVKLATEFVRKGMSKS